MVGSEIVRSGIGNGEREVNQPYALQSGVGVPPQLFSKAVLVNRDDDGAQGARSESIQPLSPSHKNTELDSGIKDVYRRRDTGPSRCRYATQWCFRINNARIKEGSVCCGFEWARSKRLLEA
ncbi:hypothetical protein N7527_005151 [Penicillium freii]|nr:hypothetical protein N7527_005151 [Penicillium freii]